MAFQPRARTPREFRRRHEKPKQRAKAGRREENSSYQYVEKQAPNSKDIVDRTFNSLHHLGTQRFAIPPYHEHFDRWLLNLRNVLSEFEPSVPVGVDDRFMQDSARILSEIELTLQERRLKEVSREEAIRVLSQKLSEARSLLAQVERQDATKAKELSGQRDRAVKPALTRIGKLRGELDRIVRMRAGFLRGISKKTKAQKTAETTQRLDLTKRELANIEKSYATEHEKLQADHESRRRQVLQQIEGYQKEIESLEPGSEVNDALEARRLACDALITAIDSLLQRNKSDSLTTGSSERSARGFG